MSCLCCRPVMCRRRPQRAIFVSSFFRIQCGQILPQVNRKCRLQMLTWCTICFMYTEKFHTDRQSAPLFFLHRLQDIAYHVGSSRHSRISRTSGYNRCHFVHTVPVLPPCNTQIEEELDSIPAKMKILDHDIAKAEERAAAGLVERLTSKLEVKEGLYLPAPLFVVTRAFSRLA